MPSEITKTPVCVCVGVCVQCDICSRGLQGVLSRCPTYQLDDTTDKNGRGGPAGLPPLLPHCPPHLPPSVSPPCALRDTDEVI